MLWATFSWGICAQTEDIATGFNRPNVQEAQALRAILAEPIPQNVLFKSLRLHLRAKEAAANKLGDEAQLEATLRATVRLLPDPVYKNNLARRLLNKGQFEEGNELMRPVIAAQMRERIAVLEGERLKLQAEIKLKFPDYEKLVHPATGAGTHYDSAAAYEL